MKKKSLYIGIGATLLIGVLGLSGCGEKQQMPGEDMAPGMDSVMESGAQEVTEEGTGEGTQTDGGDASEKEEEPYILTFEATTTEGEALTSDIFAQSKLTMINVWATYCNPCLAEMPDLGEIATEYDTADFQMIGIISDVMAEGEEEDIDYAKELIVETGATTYPHLLLNESLYVNLVGAVSAVPTTFFVNQEGELLGYLTGAQAKITWTSLIDDLLAEME